MKGTIMDTPFTYILILILIGIIALWVSVKKQKIASKQPSKDRPQTGRLSATTENDDHPKSGRLSNY